MNTLEKIKNKIQIIEECFNIDVYKYVEEKYGQDYCNILQGKIENKELIEILNTCKNKEKWTGGLDYAKDVLLGWVTEDLVVNIINNLNGFTCNLNSIDAERKFLKANDVKSSPDLLVKRERIQANNGKCVKEKSFMVEIVTDFSGFWEQSNKLHFRTTKLDNLKRHAENNTVCVLALDLKNKKFGFIKINDNTEAKYIEKHKGYKDKPAWEIEIDYNKFRDITELKNVNYLQSLLERGYIVIIIESYQSSLIFFNLEDP